MADDFRVAGGYVEVVARVNERTGRDAAEKVTRDVERELAGNAPAFEGAGKRAGTALGSGMAKTVENEVGKGVERTRKKIEDEGDKSGKGFLRTFSDGFKGGWGGFLTSITFGFAGPGLESAFKASPLAASIGLALAAGVVAVAAPAIGAGIIAALGVGSGLGVILAGSLLALSRDPVLKAAGGELGRTIMGVDTAPLETAVTDAQMKLAQALTTKNAAKIATAKKDLADAKKELADAVNFNNNNLSLPDMAVGAFRAPLLDAIGQIKSAFQQLAPDLGSAFQIVAPFLPQLTQGFVGLVKNALPGFLDFLKSAGPSLTVFAEKLPELGTALTKMFDAFTKGGPGAAAFLGDFIGWIGFMLVYLATLISWLSRGYLAIRNFLTSIPGWTRAAWEWLQRLWSQITGFFGGIWKSITSSVSKGTDDTLGYFSALPGRVGRALARIPGLIADTFRNGLRNAAFLIGAGVGEIVHIWDVLPNMIWDALKKLPDLLVDLWHRGLDASIAVVKSQINLTIAEIKAVPHLIGAALSGLGNLLSTIWDNSWRAAVGVIKYQIGVVTFEVRRLPGMLWDLGGDIIGGLVNGIERAAGRLWSLARDLAGRFLSGFKSALGISSPSKVMDEEVAQAGIGAGLIQGLEKTRNRVGGAAGMLADAVVRPFGALDVKPGATAPAGASGTAGASGSFGPYVIELDGATVAAFVIDTVTGAPRAVAAAADEGRRQRGFVGSRGRG